MSSSPWSTPIRKLSAFTVAVGQSLRGAHVAMPGACVSAKISCHEEGFLAGGRRAAASDRGRYGEPWFPRTLGPASDRASGT